MKNTKEHHTERTEFTEDTKEIQNLNAPWSPCLRAFVRVILVAIFSLMLFANGLYAQDFGFGFDEEAGADETAAVSKRESPVKVSGEILVELAPYVHDFDKGDDAQAISYWDMVSGSLKLSAAAGSVDAYAAFNLSIPALSELWDQSSDLGDPTYTPLIMDEAYLRGFIGPVNIEAGLRKLSWGKADSLGPLDVINPLDYSDLRNISDIQAIKIARPMVHVTWNAGGFSKLETVFIPNFAGHRFAQDPTDRWAASRFTTMQETAPRGILAEVKKGFPSHVNSQIGLIPIGSFIDGMSSAFDGGLSGFSPDFPDTSSLNYFQTGLRFTTTIGPVDIGAQYFYGNLFQPDFTIGGVDTFVNDLRTTVQPLLDAISTISDPTQLSALVANLSNLDIASLSLLSAQIKYNRYHQLGVDYAQVLFGFNVRAEFAVHLTDDLKGDDGSVRNPFIGWSLGFDRDLFWGISANIQCNETIRLLDGKVGSNPILDCEADTNVTSTRFTMHFSKKFFRDELESKAIVIWDVENMDCYIIPGLAWTVRDLAVELSAGVFAGDSSGDLGQYWENSFVKVGVKYSF